MTGKAFLYAKIGTDVACVCEQDVDLRFRNMLHPVFDGFKHCVVDHLIVQDSEGRLLVDYDLTTFPRPNLFEGDYLAWGPVTFT